VADNSNKTVLEVLATHEDYRKHGFGSRLLQWGSDEADKHALESYLDAASAAKGLYEKFGFVEQAEKRDSAAFATPLLRPAKK
jgi:ribosomal protein S18 acetylase RimI-like enzyme